MRKGRRCTCGGPSLLVLLFTRLLTIALPCQRFLHPALLARFQIIGVALHFLDDVFLLDFPLEATQCVLQRLALLQPYFCQREKHLPTVPMELASYRSVFGASQAECVFCAA